MGLVVRAGVCAALLAGASGAGISLRAQTWDAQLIVDPYPSPYLSDWETVPNISSLTVTNPTGQDRTASLVYRVTNQAGQLLASGRSDAQTLPPGPTTYSSFVDITGSSSHDAALESQMRRTGRLPEGDYTLCVVVTDPGGFVLAEECVQFAIVYPDPPQLIAPFDKDAFGSPQPSFQWTPLQVPIGYRLQYVLRVSEVMDHQTPDEALRANIPHYENYDVGGPNHEYPITARALETGKRYAWRVQALDQHGYPPAANDGMSEVWTFRYAPEAVEPQGPFGEFEVGLSFFDPAGPLPEFWAVLDTASFDDAAAFFQSEIRDGVLDIPLPLNLSLLSTAIGPPLPDAPRSRGDGPAPAAGMVQRDCSKFSGTKGLFGLDRDKGAITAGFTFEPGTTPLFDCIGAPGWMSPSVGQALSLMFAVQYKTGGIPQVTLGIKPPALGLLSRFGINLQYAVFVLNLTRDFELTSADLPDNVGDFYGDHKIKVWGQGQDDLVKNLAGAIRKRSATTAIKMLGLNFYGKLDVTHSPLFAAVFSAMCLTPVNAVCVSEDIITLRGFAGDHSHGSTFRGFSVSADSGAAAAGLVKGENWGLWASVPTTPPAWPPFLQSWVTKRELQFELVSLDISKGTGLTLGGEAPQRNKIRLGIRDVLTGFEALKQPLRITSPTLSFYGELRAELTTAAGPDTTITMDTVFTRARANAVRYPGVRGDTLRPMPDMGVHADTTIKTDQSSWWSRMRFSPAWGMKGTVAFGDHFRLVNPEIRLMRSDPDATLLANPLRNATVALTANWGLANLGAVGDIDELGTFIVEFGTKPRSVTRSTPTVELTPGQEHVRDDSTTTIETRPRFKVTARLSQDAALDKIIELLSGFVGMRP